MRLVKSCIMETTRELPDQFEPSPARAFGVLLWTLLPSITMWIGLYQLNSATWAFALYHFVYLVPAIIIGRTLWRKSLVRPTVKGMLVMSVVAVLYSLVAILGFEIMSTLFLSHKDVVALLNRVGWSHNSFWMLSIYAVIVNPFLEELFWRGVVLNELDRWKLPFKHFGIMWSSFTYALFHYLIFKLVLFPFYAEIGIAMLAIYGAILAVVYRKTGSIITTAFAHGLLADTAAVSLMINLARHYPNTF